MKGIATQTILLILIGVLVVGIMGYLLYKSATTKGFSLYECKAHLINICRICRNTGWSGNYSLTPEPKHSIIDPCLVYDEFYYWDNNVCCDNSAACGNTETDCNTLMGTMP